MTEEKSSWLTKVIFDQLNFASIRRVRSICFDEWSVCESLIEAELVAIDKSGYSLAQWFERYLVYVHLVVKSCEPD